MRVNMKQQSTFASEKLITNEIKWFLSSPYFWLGSVLDALMDAPPLDSFKGGLAGTCLEFGQGERRFPGAQGNLYKKKSKKSSDLAHYFSGGIQIHKIKNKWK